MSTVTLLRQIVKDSTILLDCLTVYVFHKCRVLLLSFPYAFCCTRVEKILKFSPLGLCVAIIEKSIVSV